MTKNVTATIVAMALAACLSGTASAASPNLIQNGSFENLTNGTGQLGYNTDAVGWTTNGYNFAFNSGTADTSGTSGSYGYLGLWGPGNGSNNGLTDSSPDGGNFIANDGAFGVAPLQQTITGLTAGNKYAVSFYWGAAQQSGYNGDTTDMWTVSLGNQSFATPIETIPSHGFSGWHLQTFEYTATSNTEVLSFLAKGTPEGVPPFALLDGVSMKPVPEAGTVVSMFIGILMMGAFVRRRAVAKKLS